MSGKIMQDLKHHNSGFTLMEIMVVVIIIGVLAGMAIPGYNSTLERSRSGEAVQILTAMRGAQKRIQLETGNYTNNCANLDLTIPAPANYNAPVCLAAADETADLVTIQRNGGSFGNYTVAISGDGTLSCTGGTGNICTKMQF